MSLLGPAVLLFGRCLVLPSVKTAGIAGPTYFLFTSTRKCFM